MATSLLNAPRGPSFARQHYRGRARARRLALRLVRMFAYVAIIALAITGWYLAKRGFGQEWRYQLVEELRKRGVEASVGRLTLDPFRGLIAQNVRIYDFKSRNNTLALINQVALDINYAALFHHQPFLNALDVRDAHLTLPLSTEAGAVAKAELTEFRAHIYFPPEQIHVSEASAVFCGVRLSATGQLIKRSDYEPPDNTSPEEWRRRIELLQRVITELGRFRFPGEMPSIQVKFSGDVSQMEAARAEATIRGEHLQRGNCEVRNLAIAAEWADQKLSITHCEWSDASGRFSARANWDRRDNTADFQAHSTANARELLEAFDVTWLRDISFSAPPVLDIAGSANFTGATPRLSVIGRAAAPAFTYRNVPLSDFAADFSWDGERTMLRDVRLRHETGELRSDVLAAPDDFRLNLDSTINPTAIAAAAPPGLARFLSDWEWRRPPALRLNIRGTARNPEAWSGEGSIALERARFRGVWMNGANANLRFANHAVAFDNVRIVRDEGAATGSASYDFAKREVHFTNVHSSLRATDAIYWVEPRYYKHVAPYRFRQPPNVTINGVIHFGTPGDHLELLVDAASGMDYDFLGKTLPLERVSGRLLFTDGRLQLSDLTGALYDGVVRANVDLALSRDDHPYSANVSVEGIDFPKLTDLYFKYQSAHGRLSGSYDFTGAGDNARIMRGAGKLKVTEGNVFAIPIFGPLSGLLSAIIPGAGYSVAHQATASFTIQDGVIRTNDFKVSGKLFGMVGHGDIRFIEDKLDFDLKVSGGGPGVLLTPVYDLFEYKGEGSIAKPNWHPKRF